MLDGFEILTTSGVVLWSRSYVPVNTSLVNGFIKDVFIEEKVLPGGAAAVAENDSAAKNLPYKKDQYTLKWASVKDLGLIFVVRVFFFCLRRSKSALADWPVLQAVYQSLLHLSWIDKLLDNIRVIFTDLYKDHLRKPHTSLVECDFDVYFDQQVKELEGSADKNALRVPQQALDDLTPPSGSENGYEDAPPPIPGLLTGKDI